MSGGVDSSVAAHLLLEQGHEVLVIGPPPLAETVERARYPFAPGAAPPEEELGRVWGRVPTLSYEEAEARKAAGLLR